MNEYVEIHERALEILHEDGWIKGARHANGDWTDMVGHCIVGAIQIATGTDADHCYSHPAAAALSVIAREQFPERHLLPCLSVADFNDAQETTWEDVEKVLEKAIAG